MANKTPAAPPPAKKINAPEPPPRPSATWAEISKMTRVLIRDRANDEAMPGFRITARVLCELGGEQTAADPGDYAYQWPTDPSRFTVLPADVADELYEIVDQGPEPAPSTEHLDLVPAKNRAGTPLGFKLKKSECPTGTRIRLEGGLEYDVIGQGADSITLDLYEKPAVKKTPGKRIKRLEVPASDTMAYLHAQGEPVELVVEGEVVDRGFRLKAPVKVAIGGNLLDGDPGDVVVVTEGVPVDVHPATELEAQGYTLRAADPVPTPAPAPAVEPAPTGEPWEVDLCTASGTIIESITLPVGELPEKLIHNHANYVLRAGERVGTRPAYMLEPDQGADRIVEDEAPYTSAPGLSTGPGLPKILEICANVLKRMRKPWAELHEHEQRMMLEDLDHAIGHVVVAMIEEVATQEFPAISAALESVAVKDGLKVTLAIPASHPHKHELIDRVKQPVVVVLIDPARWTAGPRPKPEPDQPDLLEKG